MTDKKPKYRFDEYLDMRTWKKTPITDSWKDKLAEEMYNWAKDDPEAFKISQFYLERGISNGDFMRWIENHEKLKVAHEAALMMVGNRREIGAIKNKFNVSMILPSMPKYDKKWKDLAEWRAALRAQAEGDKERDIKVIIENFRSEEPDKPVKKSKPKNP